MNRILFITSIWPEPRSSAAGVRMMNVIHAASQEPFILLVCSPATNEEARLELEGLGIVTKQIKLNDSEFDKLLLEFAPSVVIMERFFIEEQFGGRVSEVLPQAARILDTCDLHSLRRAREKSLTNNRSDLDWQGDDLLREVASIYRSDLTWVVSDFELKFLVEELGITRELVCVSRFSDKNRPLNLSFKDRNNFVMIGNFRHSPNHDSVLWLKNDIWPLVRKKLPEATVHIFGAYPPKELQKLHDIRSGFYFEGWADNARDTLTKYRVNLAPLRFGAGIKGKIIDGWASDTPCAATSVAAEGMTESFAFGGLVTGTLNPQEFADCMITLHENQTTWEQKSSASQTVFDALYDSQIIETKICDDIKALLANLSDRRKRNLVGQILRLNSHRATTYFSRWIELKNKQ